MFITKKKFAEEIEKAVRKREEEIWQHERIGRIQDDFYRRTGELEKRIILLENSILGKTENSVKKSCDSVACDPSIL